MRKKLNDLLKNLEYKLIQGNLNQEVSGVFYDSRKCQLDSLFVAILGITTDGHNFIAQAINQGAKIIVTNKEIKVPKWITVIKTKDTRKALAIIGCNYYDNPSRKMKVVGITGTNGKTTTIHILKAIYENAGYKVGLIGTIGASVGEMNIPCKNTTPESLDLQRILGEMVRQEVDYCFMEVSSHALALDRVYATKFYAGIYTNLSPDHMEFHGNMENYYKAKKKLFLMTENFNIINIDDLFGKRLFEELKNTKNNSEINNYTLGIKKEGDFKGKNIEYTSLSVKYDLLSLKASGSIYLKIPGKVNVYNSLTAASFALTDNISFEELSEGIRKVEGVKGRFETVYKDENFQVVIDFAHTEESLREVISSLRPFAKKRIILVFGVYAPSGDKGRTKRLAMGKVASQMADVLIVTSDNPKNLDPQFIIREIIEGIESVDQKKNIYSYIDRREAIEKAINMAEKNDLVIIAGKGHEAAQIIGNQAIAFNEKEIVLETVAKIKTRQG